MTKQPAQFHSSGSAQDARARRRDLREARAIFITSGRLLLAAAPVAVIIARLTRSYWGPSLDPSGAPSRHWIPVTAMVLAFLWAVFLPYLLLPVTNAILVELSDGSLNAPTVLGRRRIDADSAQAEWSLPIPGRTTSVLSLLRDENHAWFLIEDTGILDFSADPEPPEALIEAIRAAPIPRRQRLLGWLAAASWFACTIAICLGLGVVVYGLT